MPRGIEQRAHRWTKASAAAQTGLGDPCSLGDGQQSSRPSAFNLAIDSNLNKLVRFRDRSAPGFRVNRSYRTDRVGLEANAAPCTFWHKGGKEPVAALYTNAAEQDKAAIRSRQDSIVRRHFLHACAKPMQPRSQPQFAQPQLTAISS
jgi:hypothetical protein